MKKSRKDISKKLSKILAEGTPKQKALLVCKNWTEQNVEELYGEKPLLTEEEVKDIEDSLITIEEKRTYFKWIVIYNTYLDIAPVFGLGYSEYLREARHLETSLALWEAYEQEADTLNTAYLAVKETGSEEAVEAFEDAINRRSSSLQNAKIKKGVDGFFFVDIFEKYGLYDSIKKRAESVTEAYRGVKAFIIALTEFTEETKSKEFLPDILKATEAQVRQGHEALDISPVYSRRELRLRKERGEKITKNDELRAVFPDYEEIQPRPEHLELFRDKIRSINSAVK